MLESAETIQIVATAIFAVAILHTFSVSLFAKLAHKGGRHAGLWHYLAEVEAVFGIYAAVLFLAYTVIVGLGPAKDYAMGLNFTEPLFVFAIMVVAASRPILEAVGRLVRFIANILPLPPAIAMYAVTLTIVPLTGSLITEPAAMTLAALLLRDEFFKRSSSTKFKYATVGALFVNISIGGVLTHFAAPPVLMVAAKFGWDTPYMLTHYGWRATCALFVITAILTFIFRKHLTSGEFGGATEEDNPPAERVPGIVILIHILFLGGIVFFAHYPVIFLGLLLFFMGFTEAYNKHQSPLMVQQSLMVGFFLAGLVTLGGLQQWWLQPLLGGLEPTVLYVGATLITGITDNAALTYLGSLVEGTSATWKYMLVAGAVTGGGLTVIANAPNPAGFSILKDTFDGGTITPKGLLLAAVAPTLIAAFFFMLPVGPRPDDGIHETPAAQVDGAAAEGHAAHAH